MNVIWTAEAEQDRLIIWNYISSKNSLAAIRLDETFSDAVIQLSDYPQSGRAGIVEGTRELTPHKNYRLIYEIKDETIWILALVHSSRNWPL
jgi:toxin ParE1/3/4